MLLCLIRRPSRILMVYRNPKPLKMLSKFYFILSLGLLGSYHTMSNLHSDVLRQSFSVSKESSKGCQSVKGSHRVPCQFHICQCRK